MKRLTFIMLTFMVLSGCSNSLPKMPEMPKLPKFSMPSWTKVSLPSIDIYKPTILQGSILDINDVNQLELGMSKNTVMNLIGSPSISDPFHKYQWDYINHSTINGEQEIHYRLKLVFSGEVLSEIDKTGLDGLSSNQ